MQLLAEFYVYIKIKRLFYIVLILQTVLSGKLFAQEVPKPSVQVDSLLFLDSCLITVSTDFEGAVLLIEHGEPGMYIEFEEAIVIKETKTLRFKASHPDYEDSEVKVVKVYKTPDKTPKFLVGNEILTNNRRALLDKNSNEWLSFTNEKVVFQFLANKSIKEVEILSLIDKENNILPPKKASLYAYLKNGKKVHIRTTNTIGKFSSETDYYSHTLIITGKPKLKKILRKTEYFSLEAFPHVKNGVLFSLYFDEIMIR